MRLRSSLILMSAALFVLCCVSVPEASSLSEAFSKRPRLYLSESKLNDLRQLKENEPYASWITNIKKRGRGLMGRRVPTSLVRYNSNSLRRPADAIVNFALYYLITGDESAFDNVVGLLETFCGTTEWAGNNDLGAGHAIFALSVAYDWLYDELPSTLRVSVRESIASHAAIFHNMLRSQDFWWTRSPLQNHNYINTAALAVAGIALYGKDARASQWIRTARDNFQNVLSLLSPDGASHEGVGYWSYGTLWLLNYYMAMAPAQGLEQVKTSPFFSNTATYRLYISLPGFRYNVDYADSPMVDYKGPGAILRCLAAIFDDGHAQWLAQKVETERSGRSALWQDLIWYDPDVEPVSPDDLATYRWFDNIGLMLARSSWEDDATLAFFKAGPPQGFHAQSKGVYAGSHIHPDAGSYTYWLGRKALVQDDGYVMTKLSSSHNTLTFGGLGQLGEGSRWFRIQPMKDGGGYLDEPVTVIEDRYQMVSAEFSTLYPELAKVDSWNRTFVVIEGRAILVRDKVYAKGRTDIRSLIHLTRKARKYGDSICLNFSSNIVLEAESSVGESRIRRYSILTRPMGRDVPRSGMLYSVEADNASSATLITVIAPSDGGCVDSTVLTDYSPEDDRAVVESKYGSYEVDFSSMDVEFRQEQP